MRACVSMLSWGVVCVSEETPVQSMLTRQNATQRLHFPLNWVDFSKLLQTVPFQNLFFILVVIFGQYYVVNGGNENKGLFWESMVKVLGSQSKQPMFSQLGDAFTIRWGTHQLGGGHLGLPQVIKWCLLISKPEITTTVMMRLELVLGDGCAHMGRVQGPGKPVPV